MIYLIFCIAGVILVLGGASGFADASSSQAICKAVASIVIGVVLLLLARLFNDD